jgi:phosphomannomutase
MGIPKHVCERDGLLMSLLLTELMAWRGQRLDQLVAQMLEQLGNLDYNRRDLRITAEQKRACMEDHLQAGTRLLSVPSDYILRYQQLFSPAGEDLMNISYADGIKFELDSGAWLLLRASGTEPLVRVYAEAANPAQVEALLDIGCRLVQP